jgi:hypothetical protein
LTMLCKYVMVIASFSLVIIMTGTGITEPFQEAELLVTKPESKHWMLGWKPSSYRQSWAYNSAVKAIAEARRFNVLHQVGSHDLEGYQAWEFWYPSVEQVIKDLMPEVHAKARELYEL